MTLDAKTIEALAKQELAAEEHRRQIDEAKARLRVKRSFWERLFPFKITITRR